MQHYYDEAYTAVEKKIRNPFLDESLMKPLDSFESYARSSINPINYTLTAEAINRRIRNTLGLEEDLQVSFDRQRPPSSDECCTANPDWLIRRNTYADSPFTLTSAQVDIKPAPFAHDDNNNVDKKTISISLMSEATLVSAGIVLERRNRLFGNVKSNFA